ncbi:MAG: hypothetical protein HS111_28990 [Kofleriaceae bacterium]|nr:hypothetical protein [Kofleriaceae bacterium]
MSLRNLDLFAPHTVFAENVHNELSASVRWRTSASRSPAASSSAGWSATTSTPTTAPAPALLRRRVRALVEARLDVPEAAVALSVRPGSRASAAASAVPEILPGVGDTDAARINSGLIRWHTCERAGFAPGTPAT